MGGKVDIYNLSAILYLADLKHLSKYGTLILGETYIATKYSPVPFNIFCAYMQLKDDSSNRIVRYNLSEYIMVADTEVIALSDYDGEYLSENEVASFFETLQENKNISSEELLKKVCNRAWQDAGITGEMSLNSIAESSGADNEMLEYIKKNIENELHSFHRKK